MIWDMLLMSLIHSIEKEGTHDKGQEMLLVWTVWKSILPWIHTKQSKNSRGFCSKFSTLFESKEGKIDDKTYKTKIAYKKEVACKIDYRFVKTIIHVFCIAAFHIVMRSDCDDFWICFLWFKHNCHFFVDVACFFLLLLLMLFLLLTLLFVLF